MDAARSLGRARAGPHGARRQRRARCAQLRLRRQSLSVGGAVAPTRHSSGARHTRPLGTRTAKGLPTRVPGSTMAKVDPALATATEATPVAGGYAFLPAEGESLHQIPVGPVHAGIIEPGHFRFTANGEAVVRLEARLGYVHKGTERLMEGAPLDRAAVLAGRVSGDSTVAYALAFARAIEAAHGIDVPRRAVWLRALMGELERLANHFGDIGAICNDAAFAMMHAQCGHLREQVLRVADSVLRSPSDDGSGRARRRAARSAQRRQQAHSFVVGRKFAGAFRNWSSSTTTPRRSRTGPSVPAILSRELVRQFGCGGYVGRASGRSFDARRSPGYPPYDALQFEVPVREEGDVDARIWIRIREVEQSVALDRSTSPTAPTRADRRSTGAAGFHGGARRDGAGRGFSWRRARVGQDRRRRQRSSAAICAIRHGSNGHCSRPRSKATSSPTFLCATNRSTVRTRAMISSENAHA